ncbi:MAG: hypothetical protein ACM32E_12895 [Gemmatimonadota bacterium]
MIRMPGRPGQRDTPRWPDQPGDDAGWPGRLRDDAGWPGRLRDDADRLAAPEWDPGAGGGLARVPQPRLPAGDPEWPARQAPGGQGPAGQESAGQEREEPEPEWRRALAPVPVPWQQPGPQAQRPAPGGDPAAWRPAGAAGPAGDPLLHPVPLTERPVIGDELRLPRVWCQAGRCIARHADPEALGEADARARAIAAGWREDAFGRLICPACQQGGDYYFWIAQPVIRWDRGMAFAMTSLLAAAVPEDAVGAAGAETGVLPAALPVPPPRAAAGAHGQSRPEAGRHRRHR